jgi:hypothetical protein
MTIRRSSFSSSVALPPVVTTSAVQQFNQDRASFVCYVSANDYLTTASFQYNTTNNWSSYSTVLAGTTFGNNQMMHFNVTGLSAGTTYYVRAVAESAAGTATGYVVSFTTWSLKTYLNTTAGSFSVNVPSITPIGEGAIAPSIYEMLLYGGGGGANYGGGGGGGYRLFSGHASSTAGTQNVTGTIGAGGAAGNGGGGTGSATSGGNTTLTIGSTTWTGGGGTAGQHPGACGGPSGRGGTVGTGSNGNNLGGTNTYGYYTIVGYVQVVVGYNQYCCASDKFGNCTAYCPDYNSPIYAPDYNQPIYGYDCAYYASGGGGGTDSAGASACCQNTSSHIGGAGGAGGGAYGLRGGNGGGGFGTQGSPGGGSVPSGSGPVVGSGGSNFAAGTAGGITFKYYGP